MNKKLFLLFVVVIAVSSVAGAALFAVSVPPLQAQEELDFTVTGTNDCLRFLERTVKLCYTPFRTGVNEQRRLTIDCVKMPGSGGWTDLYVYEGYWDDGADHLCFSEDLYPIVKDIPASEFRMNTNDTFSEVFGGSAPRSTRSFSSCLLAAKAPSTSSWKK